MNSVTQNYEKEMLEWRHDFHAHPELNFDLDITSSKVADILKSFGPVSYTHLTLPTS